MADTSLQLHTEAAETSPARPRLWARLWARLRDDVMRLQPVPVVAWALALVAFAVALGSIVHDQIGAPSVIGVVACIPAALVDLVEHRLPNRLVVAAGLALASALLISGLAGGADRVDHVALGAGMMTAPLLVMHLVSPASMGFGDVKLAVVLGASLGAAGPQLALLALCLASAGTAVVGLSAGRRHLPFGPGLVAGAVLALAIAPWSGGAPT